MSLHRRLLFMAALWALLLGVIVADSGDDGDDPTMNACITPRACFQNNLDQSVTYCVTSGWYIKYPQQLRANLANVEAITNINWKADPNFDYCGWNVGIDGVSRQSVARGWIYYKYNNATLENRPPNLPLDIAPVVQVMLHTYPIVEIMVILTVLVFLPAMLALSCCVLPILIKVRKSWRESATRRKVAKAERKKQQAIEGAKKKAQEAQKAKKGAQSSGSDSGTSESPTEGWNDKDLV